jgi:hypothetical protein
VYFGTDFDDVNGADTSDLVFRGNQHVMDVNYEPGNLDLLSTYYWRIDEVNGADVNSPWKGEVWNFTVKGPDIYVDADANGANDGSSWADAFNYLQDALAAASSGDEIWVAEGIYTPDSNTAYPNGTGDRKATFQLVNGATIYGGFPAGGGEWEGREPNKHETILSGDLGGNDVDVNDPEDLLDEPTRADNSYHVVNGTGTEPTAVLDGLTITGGNASGSTAYSDDWGGGMYNYALSSSVTSSPTVRNCVFTGNSASSAGGAIMSLNSNSTLTNCRFNGNFAGNHGGCIINGLGNLTVIDCTFSDNSAGHSAGAINNSSGNYTLIGCTFNNNRSGYEAGAIYNGAGHPTLLDCVFRDNSAEAGGGAIYNYRSSPILNNCKFIGNSTGRSGGAMRNAWGDSLTLIACSFVGNSAAWNGGAIVNHQNSSSIRNCIFSGNLAERTGGAISSSQSSPKLVNCTFAGNSSPSGNALAFDSYNQESPSNIELSNCILWYGDGGVWNNDGSTITIAYSDVEGGWGGEGNVDSDPCFVEAGYWDANGVWVDGDYHLRGGSPCIDVGDPNYVPEPNETDLDGNPRVFGARIDMGAYEFTIFNSAPVSCVVGGDRVVEAGEDCEGRVVLDGSCSSDADSTEGTNDDINDFDWYEVIDACEPNSDIYIGSGEVIECNLGLGEHLIILEVTDKAGAFDSNEVVITVEDVTPPEFSVVVEPNILWPPNGKMVRVRPEWEVSDNCDEEVEVSLVDISMNVEGDINDYVQIGDDGSIYLRARKSKGVSGRIYTLTYQAVDDAGNVTEASATVTVRHRKGPRRLGRGLVRRPGRQIYRRGVKRR